MTFRCVAVNYLLLNIVSVIMLHRGSGGCMFGPLKTVRQPSLEEPYLCICNYVQLSKIRSFVLV